MYKLSLNFAAVDLKTMVLIFYKASHSLRCTMMIIRPLMRCWGWGIYIYIYTNLYVECNYRTETLTVNKRCALCIMLNIYIYILSRSDHIILPSIINNMRKTVVAQLFPRLACCNDSSFTFERGVGTRCTIIM